MTTERDLKSDAGLRAAAVDAVRAEAGRSREQEPKIVLAVHGRYGVLLTVLTVNQAMPAAV